MSDSIDEQHEDLIEKAAIAEDIKDQSRIDYISATEAYDDSVTKLDEFREAMRAMFE